MTAPGRLPGAPSSPADCASPDPHRPGDAPLSADAAAGAPVSVDAATGPGSLSRDRSAAQRILAGVALAVVATFGTAALPPVATHADSLEGNCDIIRQANYDPDRIYAQCTDGPENAFGWFRLHFHKYHWEPWGKVYTHCATGWAHLAKAEPFEVIYGFATAGDPYIEVQNAGFNPYLAYHYGSEPAGRARCWT